MNAILLLLMLGHGFMSSATCNQVEKKRYLALGDSYTIGESVDTKDRFPVQLVEELKPHGLQLEEPDIIAKTGWTTDELMEGIKKANPSSDYDLVTLLIGVNNQYRGMDIENYKFEFTQLLEQAIAFAEGDRLRVIVVSIPDYGITPFGQKKGKNRIAKEIDAFNNANKLICERLGVSWIDVTKISRMALRNPNLVADDGLHPSGEMYGLWIDKLLPSALEILK